MEEVAQVLDGDFKVSVHLVLSMTTGFIDMKTAASAFSALNPESYVFTKLDETRRCGKILDQVGDLRLPISLVTNGQRVPEDLIVPKPQDLLGLMLGRD
jgi:flagellar biosynthesis protein FlhF